MQPRLTITCDDTDDWLFEIWVDVHARWTMNESNHGMWVNACLCMCVCVSKWQLVHMVPEVEKHITPSAHCQAMSDRSTGSPSVSNSLQSRREMHAKSRGQTTKNFTRLDCQTIVSTDLGADLFLTSPTAIRDNRLDRSCDLRRAHKQG